MLDFKKYLPSTLKTVNKWTEFIEVYQDIITELKTDKVDKIINQFDFDQMDITDCVNLGNLFGYSILTYEGYTETLEYFKKEIETLVPRIKNKTTRNAYLYTYYIYNLIGDVYPLYQRITTELQPHYTWEEFNENPIEIDILDSGDDNISYYVAHSLDGDLNQLDVTGQTLDTFHTLYASPKDSGFINTTLDASDLTELDQEGIIDYILRKILINYVFKQVENEDEFLSENTLRAFYNNILRIKKRTEVPFFEPILEINYNADNTLKTTTYNSFDNTETATQRTKLISGILSDTTVIQLGTGIISDITDSISGVAGLVETIYLSGLIYDDTTFVNPFLRKRLYISGTVNDFREVAFLKTTSGLISGVVSGVVSGVTSGITSSQCLLYSTFPEVKFYENMYSNIRFDLISN